MSTEDPTKTVDPEETTPEPEPKPEALTMEKVESMIKSSTDKVRREYADKIKTKEKEIEDLTKAQMSEAERVEFERKKEADERATERQQFARDRLRFKFVKALDAEGLSIGWADIITVESEDAMPEALATIQQRIKTETDRQVQKRFKDAGFEPGSGGGGGAPPGSATKVAALQEQYAEAVKSGNHVLQIQLKNELFQLQQNAGA